MTTMLQELLRLYGLTHVKAEIEQVILPSIRLQARTVDETQHVLGTTKFGGSPDLPQGYVWPESTGIPLPFLAQINLSDIVTYDSEHFLPEDGILYFFFDVDAFFNSRTLDRMTWFVLYDRSPLSTLERATMPETIPKRTKYRPCAVTCSTELTLPGYSQYDSTSMQRLGLSQPFTDKEEQAYYQVQAQLAGTDGSKYHIPIHRLLGHPDEVQCDMHNELPGLPDDWRLLFQMDSDNAPNTNWGDTGRIYCWIRSQDLQRHDFSLVHLILQCT